MINLLKMLDGTLQSLPKNWPYLLIVSISIVNAAWIANRRARTDLLGY
jgi:hypothetical protein